MAVCCACSCRACAAWSCTTDIPIWSGPRTSWDLSDEPELINDAIANALSDKAEFPGVARTIDADRVVYAFAVRGEHIELLGVVSLIVRLSGTQIEPRPLQTVRQLVQPALECLRRELALRAKLGSSERDLNIKERDLELMMEISSNQSVSSDTDEFSLILKTGLDRMGCALAALWVPDKNISVSMTRSGQPMSPEPLMRAQHHLMAWMQMQQRTIVVNHISKVASDVAAPYKILACPIRHHSERVMGVLALFNPPSAPDFDIQQTRVAEMLAKRSTSIIQSQYDTSTGLMTRQAFERQATSLLASSGAADAHIILYLDIDRLHVINETFGMHVGDDVIVSVADRMAKTLPPAALSARISGDRLAALIPNSNMESAARDRRTDSRRRREHRAACGPGLLRGIGLSGRCANRPLRQPARARTGHRGNRLQGCQRPRPQSCRDVPGFRPKHHPPPHGHPGDRQAARRARQR